MSNIIKSGNSLLNSLDSLIKEKSEAQNNPSNKVKLLLDASGSMNGTPLNELRKALSYFPNMGAVTFNDKAFIGRPDTAKGSTDLVKGLELVYTLNPEKIILISDGQPDDPDLALSIAKIAKIPINVLYIGDAGDAGDLFMTSLAKATGGKKIVLGRQTTPTPTSNNGNQIANNIKGLLG
jgi:hypothetical protein